MRKTLQNISGSLNIHMYIYTLLSIYGLGDWQPVLEKQEWGLKRFYGTNSHHSDSLPLLKYHNC